MALSLRPGPPDRLVAASISRPEDLGEDKRLEPRRMSQGAGKTKPRPPSGSVTVVIVQRVRRGQEARFRRWQQQLNDQCAEFDGFQGAEVGLPVAGIQDDHVVLFRFDTSEHLDARLQSDVRKRALTDGASFFGGAASEHLPAPAQMLVGNVASVAILTGSYGSGSYDCFVGPP